MSNKVIGIARLLTLPCIHSWDSEEPGGLALKCDRLFLQQPSTCSWCPEGVAVGICKVAEECHHNMLMGTHFYTLCDPHQLIEEKRSMWNEGVGIAKDETARAAWKNLEKCGRLLALESSTRLMVSISGQRRPI